MLRRHQWLSGLIVVGLSAWAEGTAPVKLKGTMKQSAPKIDLGLPSFDPLPTTPKLERATNDSTTSVPRQADTAQTYTVVNVQHAKSFIRGPKGSTPAQPFTALVARGTPLTTEAFSSVLRVRSAEARNVSIEIAVHDLRGNAVMAANGRMAFKANDEQEWTVDWEPTVVRGPGEFEVHVRVGGHAQGPFPLKVIAETKP